MKKTLIALGDSITVGTYTAPTDKSPDSIAEPNYIKRVCDAFGYGELKNYAQNGVCISTGGNGPFPNDAIVLKMDKAEKGDTIIISGGTNDYAASVPIGDADSRDITTFTGAVRVLFDKVKAQYTPDSVYVITPIPRLIDKANEQGATPDDYRKVLSAFSAVYGFSCIDGLKLPIDPKDSEQRQRYMLDGLHPGPEGHELYAEMVIREMKAGEKA